jgi:hypothetical protein
MNKNKVTAWIAIAIVSFLTFIATANLLSALFVFVILAALLTRPTDSARQYAGTISVDADLNLNKILDVALSAYKRAILNLSVFAAVFQDVQLNGSDKVEVPYFPLVTSTSRDWDSDDCYVFDDTYTQAKREVTINKRKYQPVKISSTELSRRPSLNLEKVMAAAGEKLAYDVMQDVMSVITAANFGAAAFTGADTTFDSDDIADLVAVADTIPWPQTGRGMVVKPTYKANLFKDNDVKLEYAYGDDGIIKNGVLPRVMGFDFGSTPAIPANGENLVGFMAHMSAILFAQSPITPAPEVMEKLSRYEVVTDPDTGISIEYRAWGDPDCDVAKHIIEANYGYAKGNEDALRRFVSA